MSWFKKLRKALRHSLPSFLLQEFFRAMANMEADACAFGNFQKGWYRG
ncbi:hypothetical protein KKC1_31380 [Calderihabitans maritimus]|uniref:Uncharacterized protein n=1 Tax=Calderihabitans maritimus TaxID=1246530 RepID=A0A1Z5HWW5_9FIRM|nr:hypothetical protein KKC1_31380 [Calderihabitans maritimus]